MKPHSRREFLADVGHGMLVATLGAAAAAELGLIPAAFADEKASRLSFGSLEPLAGLLQDTPVDSYSRSLSKRSRKAPRCATWSRLAPWPTPGSAAATITTASTRSWP
jgi:hypothetical protein